MIHKNDLISILTLIVGVCSLATDATFGDLLNKQYGAHVAGEVLMVISIISIVFSQLIRILNAPAGQANVLVAIAQTLGQIQQVLMQPQPAPEIHVNNVMPPPPVVSPTVVPPVQGGSSIPAGYPPQVTYSGPQPSSTEQLGMYASGPSTAAPVPPIVSTPAAAAPVTVSAAPPQGAPNA